MPMDFNFFLLPQIVVRWNGTRACLPARIDRASEWVTFMLSIYSYFIHTHNYALNLKMLLESNAHTLAHTATIMNVCARLLWQTY